MPIQPENKVTPFILPPTPDKKEDLIKWAQDINQVLNKVNRQLVDQFNRHISGTHGHPNSWAKWKVARPSFRTDPSTVAQLLVDASSSKPALFVIGSQILESTSPLTMNMNTSGVGGLRVGLSKTANTIYYLYGVNNGGSPALLADTNDPNTGPSGYNDWTYVGAFITEASSNIANDFLSTNGIALWGISTAGHQVTINSSSITAFTLLVPTTAKHVYVLTTWNTINAAGDAIRTSGISGSATSKVIAGTTTAANAPIGLFWQSIPTAQTIYARVTTTTLDVAILEPMGWVEFPQDFK